MLRSSDQERQDPNRVPKATSHPSVQRDEGSLCAAITVVTFTLLIPVVVLPLVRGPRLVAAASAAPDDTIVDGHFRWLRQLAYAINNAGHVVGESRTGAEDSTRFCRNRTWSLDKDSPIP